MKMEIIQAQIALLVDLNRDLASQATPEAAREIRENVKMIVELTAAQNDDVVANLEERLEALEEALFGDEDPAEAMERLNGIGSYLSSLTQFIGDCREDINTLFEIDEEAGD